jgi:hypothetical protein
MLVRTKVGIQGGVPRTARVEKATALTGFPPANWLANADWECA